MALLKVGDVILVRKRFRYYNPYILLRNSAYTQSITARIIIANDYKCNYGFVITKIKI